MSEGNADTLRALHILLKMSVCTIDKFRTEYKTLLCDSNPKLGYNHRKMAKYPFAADFNDIIVCPPERAEGTAYTFKALHIVSNMSECAIDTFKTKYRAILYDSSSKLG